MIIITFEILFRHQKQGILTSNEKSTLTHKEIKNNEIVVFKSDKCGKLTIDSTENYLEALKVHTESHEKIDLETASKIKGKMNEHLAHFNKIHKSH